MTYSVLQPWAQVIGDIPVGARVADVENGRVADAVLFRQLPSGQRRLPDVADLVVGEAPFGRHGHPRNRDLTLMWLGGTIHLSPMVSHPFSQPKINTIPMVAGPARLHRESEIKTPPDVDAGSVLLRRVIIQTPQAHPLFSGATGIPPPTARQQQRRIPPRRRREPTPQTRATGLRKCTESILLQLPTHCNLAPIMTSSSRQSTGSTGPPWRQSSQSLPPRRAKAPAKQRWSADHAGDDEITQAPQKNARRGPKIKPAGPFVKLRLWSLYPGLGAPPRLETLCKRLRKRGDDLAERCGFIDGVPDRKTFRARFKKLDLHPHLIEAALRAISLGFVQQYLIPPDPVTPPEQNDRIRRNRTAECNSTRSRNMRDGLGDDEFENLVPRGSGADDFLLLHLHGGNITCHKCQPGECGKGHEHGLKERPSRQSKCPDPNSHEKRGGRCVHEVRREWRCRCCGSNVSVTSGIEGLDGTKIPLRKILRCIHHLVNSRYGISATSMGVHLNGLGRTMYPGTMLKLMHRIRKAMQETPPLPFRGTVEIDEAKVTLTDGVVHLIGAYDHATRRVYIEILDGPATQEVMRGFLNRVSLPGSRVYTDGTAAWPPGIDRTHGVVIHCKFDFGHAEELYGEGGGRFYITTNRIEGSWGLLKRKLRITTTVSCEYFPLYLAEEIWRTNHIRNPLEAANYEGEGAARERR